MPELLLGLPCDHRDQVEEQILAPLGSRAGSVDLPSTPSAPPLHCSGREPSAGSPCSPHPGCGKQVQNTEYQGQEPRAETLHSEAGQGQQENLQRRDQVRTLGCQALHPCPAFPSAFQGSLILLQDINPTFLLQGNQSTLGLPCICVLG